MLNLDPNTLLVIELSALTALVTYGLWRILRAGPSALDATDGDPDYDMRRDGQRLSSM